MILPELTGAAKAGATAFGGFLSQFGDFLQSGTAQQFFAFLSQQAGPDLHALGNVLTGASSAVLSLTQDLNPLAKTLVNAAGGVLSFAGSLLHAYPGLTQVTALLALATFGIVKLAEGWKALAGSAAVATVMKFAAAATVAAAQEGLLAAMADPVIAAWVAQVGAGQAVTAIIGEMTAADVALATAQAAVDAVSPWMWAVAAAAAVAGLAFAVVKLTRSSGGLVSQLTAENKATGTTSPATATSPRRWTRPRPRRRSRPRPGSTPRRPPGSRPRRLTRRRRPRWPTPGTSPRR